MGFAACLVDFLSAKRHRQRQPTGGILSLFHPAPGLEVFVEKRTMASLHTCDRCQASLVAYEAVCARLAQAVPPHEPPADLRQRLMAAVTDTLPLAARAWVPEQAPDAPEP